MGIFLAYRLIGNPLYKSMAENILRCLNESFEDGGVYISAHDADTGHEEGATYLWSLDELESSLTADEFLRFSETYDIESNGNFEGRNHLTWNHLPPNSLQKRGEPEDHCYKGVCRPYN